MNLNQNRSFNCKNEELPVLCGFCAISLARDLGDFAAYSPLFDANYLTTFKSKIDLLQELVHPKSETVALKVITEEIHKTLDDLIAPINRVEGYLGLAGAEIPISSTDFGLTQLRRSVRSRDVESALNCLQTVEAHIRKYQKELTAKGLTDALIEQFSEAATLLAEEKKKKYTLVSGRAAIVQGNLGLLKELHNQLSEICRVGKILYKQTDAAKLKDYTFAQMMKQVKRVTRPTATKTAPQPVAGVV